MLKQAPNNITETKCRHCKQLVPVSADATIVRHYTPIAKSKGQRQSICEGSGKKIFW